MPEVLIVADDLTGANDTGVMIAQQGLRTCTILNEEAMDSHTLQTCECISFSTDSRGIAAEDAYKRVYDATRRFGTPDTAVYSKRIDSTLRGNLGAETDAMLDALGSDRLAIIVPAFPEAGRIYVGGHLLVNGVPLYRTAAATDPKNPVRTASASALYKKQSKYPMEAIYLEELRQGSQAIAERLRSLHADGVRGVICDAVDHEDLALIAEAVVGSGVPFIAVDPGVFTAHVAAALHKRHKRNRQKKKMLFAIGSVNDVACAQAHKLMGQPDVCHVLLDTAKVLESAPDRDREIDRATREALGLSEAFDICCVCVAGIFPEKRVDLEPYAERDNVTCDDISAQINDALARVVRNILGGESAYSGLFACGGDVAVAVCAALDAYGVYPLDDVIPLAVYGRVAGGAQDGLHLITKGGMIGNDDTMLDCAAYLQNMFKE